MDALEYIRILSLKLTMDDGYMQPDVGSPGSPFAMNGSLMVLWKCHPFVLYVN